MPSRKPYSFAIHTRKRLIKIKNGLIKIEEKGDVCYFKINQRENYKNYDDNKVEWENFGTFIEKNIFKDLNG